MEEGYHLFKFGRLGPAKPASNPDAEEVVETTSTTKLDIQEVKKIQQPQTYGQRNIR
jgi:hypothetical protein